MPRLLQYRLINGEYILFDAIRGTEALQGLYNADNDFLIPSQYKKEKTQGVLQKNKNVHVYCCLQMPC